MERWKRREAGRELILDAALRCFLVRGFEATTVARIREVSGISVGSIYHLFASKEEIALTLHRDARRDYEQGFLDVLARDPRAEFGIKAGVFHHLRWVRKNRRLALFMHLCPRPEEARHGRRFSKQIRKWLAPRARRGEIRPLPFSLYLPIWIGPAREFSRSWVEDQPLWLIDEAKAALPQLAWAALRPNVAGSN